MRRLKLAGLLLAGGIVAAIIGTARAHYADSGMLYDYACCHSRDCEPVPAGSIEDLGANGYRVRYVSPMFGAVDAIVARDKAKPSKDNHEHFCGYRVGDKIMGRCVYLQFGA